METMAISASVAPEFRAWLAETGKPSGKTMEQVYALWRKYSADCESFDQSPVQCEFLDWYKDDLRLAKEWPEVGDTLRDRLDGSTVRVTDVHQGNGTRGMLVEWDVLNPPDAHGRFIRAQAFTLRDWPKRWEIVA